MIMADEDRCHGDFYIQRITSLLLPSLKNIGRILKNFQQTSMPSTSNWLTDWVNQMGLRMEPLIWPNVMLSSITLTLTKAVASACRNSLMPLAGSSIKNRIIIQCKRKKYYKFNMSSISVLISSFLILG